MLAEIKARLTKPTPLFWRKLQKRTAATAAGFAALTVTIASFSTALPPVLATSAGWAAAFFGGIASICSLAVDDPVALTPAEPPLPPPPDGAT